MDDSCADLNACPEHELPVRKGIRFESRRDKSPLRSSVGADEGPRSGHLDQTFKPGQHLIQRREIEGQIAFGLFTRAAVEGRGQYRNPNQLECIPLVSGIEKGLELNDVRASDPFRIAPGRKRGRQATSEEQSAFAEGQARSFQ